MAVKTAALYLALALFAALISGAAIHLFSQEPNRATACRDTQGGIASTMNCKRNP